MKSFTCREFMNNQGGCVMVFTGPDPMDVATRCSKQVAASTDEAHKPIGEMKQSPHHTQEDREKWFACFRGQWDRKKQG